MGALSRVVACTVCLSLAAEGAQLRSSPSMDAIAQVMQKLPIAAVTDDTGFFKDATKFLDDLKDQPAPASPFKRVALDPQPAIGFLSCSRDTTGCPADFIMADGGICTPAETYAGPCAAAVDFASMTLTAKARWADSCHSTWPCSACSKDYQSCPADWTLKVSEGSFVCEPGVAYVGACDATDLADYSAAELESWASFCGAVWPCM